MHYTLETNNNNNNNNPIQMLSTLLRFLNKHLSFHCTCHQAKPRNLEGMASEETLTLKCDFLLVAF